MGEAKRFDGIVFQGSLEEGAGQDLNHMAIRAAAGQVEELVVEGEVVGQVSVFDGSSPPNLGESALQLVLDTFPGAVLVEGSS